MENLEVEAVETNDSGWDNVAEKKDKIAIEVSYVDPYGDENELEQELDIASPDDQEEEDSKSTKAVTLPPLRKENSFSEEELKLESREKHIELAEKVAAVNLNAPLSAAQKEDIAMITRFSSKKALYGAEFNPALEDELKDKSGGKIYYAKIYRTGYVGTSRVFDQKTKTLKSRRPIPVVYEEEFFSSLTNVNNQWIFQGKLNGWPALTNLELISLQYWYSKKAGPKDLTYSRVFWTSSDKSEPKFPLPGVFFFNRKPICIRATLRAPSFTEFGYSRDNPGFVFWFKPFRPQGPRMAHGERIIDALNFDALEEKRQVPRAKKAHFYAHRYAKKNETPKDKITYHTGVLIEWDHGEYCTNIELAYMHGLGGYGGKSNWVEDRDEARPLLWQCMPDCIKAPWRSNMNEVRFTDMKVKDVEGFKEYLAKYEGPTKRFMKPHIKYSGEVRLSMNSATDLVRYVVNYTCRDPTYSEEFRNCQSFAADLFSFLVAKKDIEPLYPIKLFYTERRHLFLYDFDKFDRSKKKNIQKKDEPINSSESKNAGNKNLYQKLFG